jgi:hypothetical protein
MKPTSSTLDDQSENGYDGTVTDATYQRTLYGDALLFNGTSAKVTTSAGPFADRSHTIAFWVNVNNLTTTQYLVSNGSTSGTNRLNLYLFTNGTINYYYGSSGGSKLINSSVTTGWHHVVITRDFDGANTTAKMYLDGINVDTDVSAVTPGITDTDLILGSLSSSNWFNQGLIVDFQILSDVKDSAWVLEQMELKTEEVSKNLSRLISQFADSTNVQSLIRIFSTQMDELNEIVEALRDNTNVNDAYDAWLDIVGRIVGLERPFRQQSYATCFAFKENETDPDDMWKGFYTECPV